MNEPQHDDEIKDRLVRVVAGAPGSRRTFAIPAELAGVPEMGRALDEMAAAIDREEATGLLHRTATGEET